MNISEDEAYRPQQAAALCLKHRKGKLSVLLITSRKTKRWILPKGWLEEDKTEAEVALMEAWEEAGVIADPTSPALIGSYHYVKRLRGAQEVPLEVNVYRIAPCTLAKRYPEKKQRQRKWVSLKKAAKMVDEQSLKRLLLAQIESDEGNAGD